MNLDKMREIWKEEGGSSTMKIDKDWLLGMVRRRQAEFTRANLARDILVVSVLPIVAASFIYGGVRYTHWPYYLIAAALLCVAVFVVVDRFRWKNKAARNADPSISFLDQSLDEIDHQIWLYRNLAWWFLLPPAVGMAASFLLDFFESLFREGDPGGIWKPLETFLITMFVFYCVYWLNRKGVRDNLEPWRRELVELRQNLTNGETPDSV